MMLARKAPLTFAATCAWAAAVALTGGCASGPRPAADPGVAVLQPAPAGAAVRIRLTPPRDLAVRRGARDTVLLPAAAMLVGRVRDAVGDTVWLGVTEARTARGDFLRPGGAVVTLVRGEGMEVQVLNRHPGRAEFMTLLVPIVLLVGVWVWACLAVCGEAT